MPLHDETTLIAQLRAGDEAAFTRIYDEMFTQLYVVAVRAVRSRDVAEDLVHDVFLSLWRRRETLTIHGSLGAYLNTAIRNRVASHLRSLATRGELGTAIVDREVEIEAKSGDAVGEREVRDALRAALARLSPRRLEVLLLSRRDLLTTREIADRLGISAKTVENLIGRSLRQLRHSLGDFIL
jgi:RNA polymerase sigma-70 factor (ECF subfamily)